MRTYLDCIPCFFSQTLRAARLSTNDEKKIKRVLDEVGMMVSEIPLESTPPESARFIYQKIAEVTGNPDPYRDIKRESTQKALSWYPALKKRVEKSGDRLLAAIKIAIAGNVIDFGVNWDFDIENEIEKTLEKDFAACDYDPFKGRLNQADEVLYIGDNAGECVFDRILIEEIKKPVIYAVRNAPVINDATREDAVQAGLDQVATILSSGSDGPGTILETCSNEFKNIYKKAKLIISKGQGNYEALSDNSRPLFFLLKAKCRVIADDLGVREGDIIFKDRQDGLDIQNDYS